MPPSDRRRDSRIAAVPTAEQALIWIDPDSGLSESRPERSLWQITMDHFRTVHCRECTISNSSYRYIAQWTQPDNSRKSTKVFNESHRLRWLMIDEES